MRIVFFFLLLPLQSIGQEITGIWTGYLFTSGTQVPYELVITTDNDYSYTGYSLLVFAIDGKENIGIKSMKIKVRKNSLLIEDDELLYNNYSTPGRKITLFSTLKIIKKDSLSILQGDFFTRSLDRSSFKGTVVLQKKNKYAETRVASRLANMDLWRDLSFVQHAQVQVDERNRQTAVVPDKKVSATVEGNVEPGTEEASLKKEMTAASLPERRKELPPTVSPPSVSASPIRMTRLAAAGMETRKTVLLRTIYFEADSLFLTLYDNGEVDGDTVSVLVNDQLIIARQGLTTNAITVSINTKEFGADSLRVMMYAENLGSIPPNTGLLVIQDGEERYQVRFAGDLQTNSAVILRKKK